MILVTIPRRNGQQAESTMFKKMQHCEQPLKHERNQTEEADGCVSVLPMLLREARCAVQAVKVFVLENQGQCGFASISWGY